MKDLNAAHSDYLATPSDEKLWALHKALCYVARNFLYSNFRADPEMIHDVATKVLEKLHKFNGRSTFSTWAYRVIINTCRTEMRTQRRRRENQLSEHLQIEAPVPEEVHDYWNLVKLIEGALTLNEQTLFRFMLYGLSYKEIAWKLQTTPTSIRVRWSRLKKKIRERFGNAFSKQI